MKQIDGKICSYTEKELLSDNDVEKTVSLLKDQLKDNKHWSILIYPEGEVEYIISNEINIDYLDGLSNLIEKKNKGTKPKTRKVLLLEIKKFIDTINLK